MFDFLTGSKGIRARALQLYGSSVAQARQPVFYRDWCVADTLEGRFEMVMLHVALLLRRLNGEDAGARDLGRRLVECMFSALDDDLRELGIADMTVPKRMKAAAGSFYGRLQAYNEALGADSGAGLEECLARNVVAPANTKVAAARLAGYVRAAAQSLLQQDLASLKSGLVTFPDPSKVP